MAARKKTTKTRSRKATQASTTKKSSARKPAQKATAKKSASAAKAPKPGAKEEHYADLRRVALASALSRLR